MGIRKIKGLPLYEARLDNGKCGVLRVSLVDAPAVQSDFVSYAETERVRDYEIADEEKRRVFGVILRSDWPMFRRDPDGSEYYIMFRADQIRAFAQKYLAEGRQNEVDLEHDFKSIDGAQMVQYFIKDTASGIDPVNFREVADGSLFAEYQITDEALWSRIKEGEFHGFSVEIIHSIEPVRENKSHKNMSALSKLKEAFAAFVAEQEPVCYGRVATDKGTIIWEGEDELAADMAVWSEDADGNRIELEDGDYKADDSRIIVIASGKVSEIREAEAPAEPEVPAEPEKKEAEAEEVPAEPEAPAEPDEKDKRIAELEAENEALKARVAELEAKLAEPAGQSAHEAFSKQGRSPENPFELMRRYAR